MSIARASPRSCIMDPIHSQLDGVKGS